MEELEERANDYSNIAQFGKGWQDVAKQGYIQGAKEQLEIDKKNYRDRYKKIANSAWFTQDYRDKIVEEVIMED